MITTEKAIDKITNSNVPDTESNILEEKVETYKKEAIHQIKFSVVIKPALISFVALFISFFLDLSNVPLLGNISAKIAKGLFPTWQANTDLLVPYSFWWIPVLIYILFFALALSLFNKLKIEIIRRPRLKL